MSNHTSRRSFLKQAAGVAVTGWLAADASCLRAAAPAKHSIRLGAPVFKAPRDPEELALAHKKLGYRAAYCPGVKLSETERIRDIAQAFAKHDIVIAEVGRWCNLMDGDPAKRTANLQTVTDGLAVAEAVGARCAVDIAGSFNPKVWSGPHPKNVTREFFDLAVENARKIIDAVKPQRAKFCYEMMGWSLPDSADSYLELIKAIDRPAFGVHLDPCNVINSPDRFYRNADVINECFDKLTPWLTSCHAKDLAWEPEMNVHFREVPLGTGELDYPTYLKRLAALPADVPLMIEHMKTPEEYDQSREHLFQLGAKIGVSFR
jgi:sugar phosphate isomerase/epimerase